MKLFQFVIKNRGSYETLIGTCNIEDVKQIGFFEDNLDCYLYVMENWNCMPQDVTITEIIHANRIINFSNFKCFNYEG
jgi:hypothetical protein